ncbi:hypothetical protein HAX54_027356 [Datura stramonium]|uniref:Uncharacterized protein n=1 Tax=Datura stramonium TaxID=4076 RepID=A0ABS8V5G2_DATST|nr:hypothetical protein [Datura stramonium]
MTSTANKKQHEDAARKEIAKKRQLWYELESESSSGTESEEGGEEAEFDEDSCDKESATEKSGEQVGSNPAATPEARSKRWYVQGSDVYYAGYDLNDKGN